MNGEESELANTPHDPGMIASDTGMRARDPWEMDDYRRRQVREKTPEERRFLLLRENLTLEMKLARIVELCRKYNSSAVNLGAYTLAHEVLKIAEGK